MPKMVYPALAVPEVEIESDFIAYPFFQCISQRNLCEFPEKAIGVAADIRSSCPGKLTTKNVGRYPIWPKCRAFVEVIIY